jgi:hypothetical protein
MDKQNFETCALSDDQLDAVSGGERAMTEQQQQAMENKRLTEALKTFQQILQDP